MNVSVISSLEIIFRSQMTLPKAGNRDIRKMPKWAHHQFKEFQASEWKWIKSACTYQCSKALGVPPGCTLDCKIYKGNKHPGRFFSSSRLTCFSIFIILGVKGHARRIKTTLLRILAWLTPGWRRERLFSRESKYLYNKFCHLLALPPHPSKKSDPLAQLTKRRHIPNIQYHSYKFELQKPALCTEI